MPKKNNPGCPCDCAQQPDCLLIPCGKCGIPKVDLTLAWTNRTIGDGTTKLKFNGGSQWRSDCTHEVIYQLSCINNQIQFTALYFIAGPCPTGQSQFCSTARGNPFRLTQTKLVCGPSFELDVSITTQTCPGLAANGYTGFKITGPFAGQPPPKCRVCFTVSFCGGVEGATVTVKDGPGPGGSGKTDSNGFVAIDIGKPGTYTVTVDAPGFKPYSKSTALKCGQSVSILLELPGDGSLTFSWTANPNPPLEVRGFTSGSCKLQRVTGILEWCGGPTFANTPFFSNCPFQPAVSAAAGCGPGGIALVLNAANRDAFPLPPGTCDIFGGTGGVCPQGPHICTLLAQNTTPVMGTWDQAQITACNLWLGRAFTRFTLSQ